MSKVEFKSRDQIDDQRWNERVRSSPMFRHYYLTYYLDAACDEWEALVDLEYTWVWPLPVKRFPFRRVFQPLLTQQLGPIGSLISSEFDHALLSIQKRFWMGSIKFNDQWKEVSLKSHSHRNLELNLSADYATIQSGYKRNVVSNLKKAERASIQVSSEARFDDWIINAFQATTGKAIPQLNESFYEQVRRIFDAFLSRGEAKLYWAKEDGQNVGGVMVLITNKRILFFFSAVSEEGRSNGAMHAIVDHLIKEHTGTPDMVLDFEGSNIESLAYFYRSFGASEQIYLQGSWSRFPSFINALLS